MINERNTNIVYFSDRLVSDLKYQSSFNHIKQILDKHQINYKLLRNTKDIWCRDYMPIQIEKDAFVQFKYEPSYLENHLHLQSDPIEVLQSNGITAEFSKINLDGGNVVKWNNQAILTERIFEENTLDKNTLINQLTKELNAELHFIPAIEADMTGHSDGHLRFIDGNTILVNELKNEAKNWTRGFHKMISKTTFDFTEMPWFETNDKDSAIGIYVNYLEIENVILFPIFEVNGNKDKEALEVITKVFPDRIIEPININEIAKEGGLLNCISWSIKA
jgi:agmatine deiminase